MSRRTPSCREHWRGHCLPSVRLPKCSRVIVESHDPQGFGPQSITSQLVSFLKQKLCQEGFLSVLGCGDECTVSMRACVSWLPRAVRAATRKAGLSARELFMSYSAVTCSYCSAEKACLDARERGIRHSETLAWGTKTQVNGLHSRARATSFPLCCMGGSEAVCGRAPCRLSL